MFDDVITVYNRVYDKEQGRDVYFKTVFYKVHFEERKGANIIKSGLEQSDSILAVVLCSSTDKVYLSSKEFEKVTGKKDVFTFQSGDIIVKGDIDDEISSLKEFGQKYEYYTITSVDFYGFGTMKMRHWEIGAK